MYSYRGKRTLGLPPTDTPMYMKDNQFRETGAERREDDYTVRTRPAFRNNPNSGRGGGKRGEESKGSEEHLSLVE